MLKFGSGRKAQAAEAQKQPDPTPEPEEQENRKGILQRLRRSLSRTRAGFSGKLERLVGGKKQISPELLEELEELLIGADLGVPTTMAVIESLSAQMSRRQLKDGQCLRRALQEQLTGILRRGDHSLNFAPGRLNTVLVLGVNGSGKTTTIGKLACQLSGQGQRVLLAAADTFRAAAADQLALWARRAGADIIRHRDGADPSAVVYDAAQAARARGLDFLIIDTAGRLHTKHNLMEELKKMKRVLQKVLPEAPQETLLVLDAVTGQNALQQARAFHQALGVSALALTKLDSSARGGAIVGIVNELDIPLKLIGFGEGASDLRSFSPREFVSAFLDT